MPDVRYTVESRNLTGDWGTVCRAAVLWPLSLAKPGTLTPQQLYDKVYKYWRRRTTESPQAC